MRFIKILTLLSLTVSTMTFAQTKQVFDLNKLPQQDTLLNGWKIQSGDNHEWAMPAFDDSKWQSGDPAINVTDLAALRKTGICWIRLHIKTDSNIASEQLTAWVLQYTASEIYLNGALIKRYGTISSDPSKVVAIKPRVELFDLKLQPRVDNLIAVRLAYQPGIFYSSPYFVPLPAFSMFVNNYANALVNQRTSLGSEKRMQISIAISTGIFLILCIIHLIYFLFDRRQKVNLYYFFLSIAFCSVCACNTIFAEYTIQSVYTLMMAALGLALSFTASALFMVLTIYVLFNYKHRIAFVIMLVTALAGLAYLFYDGVNGFIIASNGILLIGILEGIRVSIWAKKHKMKGAVVILSGLIIALLLGLWSSFLDQSTTLALLTGLLAIFGFPIGMAIYLGIQHAITNQTLRSSLSEVQTLSEQNALKEQEKQQILSNQNELLEQQVTERTAELNRSLHELKSTQSQLIQSEKMASLGELTAGIAHEIQNPLNFVNNFSEVSKELLDEMKTELNNGNTEDAKEIADDVIQNLEKINHHGKRADAIVKGMLQHSQKSTGVKEQTDINALCDEYLRLSYHGLRAKDKYFNAELKTDFDESIGKINIVPQDIGRVILNLINNAFYACTERSRSAVAEKKKTNIDNYEPTVSISTKKTADKVEIKVSDNGNGIPQNILDKIFQPFFHYQTHRTRNRIGFEFEL